MRNQDDATRDRLQRKAKMLIEELFGNASSYLADIDKIEFYRSYVDEYQQWERARAQLSNVMVTVMEKVELFGVAELSVPGPKPGALGRRVFVVHGHDEKLKTQVARTLERLDLEPIILHEMPNKGRTIIEKFEDYSDVPFAVVLLTPDDMGYVSDADPSTAQPRARQNVILELGFFLGRLGRERVAALFTGSSDFEKPSDYDGVTYIPVDGAGRWQFDLIRELKAAGIEVDANKIA